MQTHVQKWGNSLGLRIPAYIAHQLHLHAGSSVHVSMLNECIIIQPQKYVLEDLLSNITSENLHKNLLDDSLVGSEEW